MRVWVSRSYRIPYEVFLSIIQIGKELVKNMQCSSIEELLSLGKSQFDYLEMAKIAPFSKTDNTKLYEHYAIHAGDIRSYILSRCSSSLHEKKKTCLIL